MHDAVAIAYRMLQVANEKNLQLSNLQLQKLVYIAYGYLLGWKEKQLFQDDICAWKYGPVIDSVYRQFKRFGAEKITVNSQALSIALEEDAEQTISGVLDLYGSKDAVYLVNLTHSKDTPWDIVWNQQGGNRQFFSEIPDSLIKRHYQAVITDPGSVGGL